MTRQHYDYASLKNEFIRTRPKLSVRELGRRHNIDDAKISSIHREANKKDAAGKTWYDYQEAFDSRSTEQTVELLAKREADRRLREAEVVDNALELIDEAISSARETVKARVDIHDKEGAVVGSEPKYRVPIRELNGLIDRLSVVLGRRTVSESDGGVNFSGNGSVDAGQLADGTDIGILVHLVRGSRGSAREPIPVGSSGPALPSAPDPSPPQLP